MRVAEARRNIASAVCIIVCYRPDIRNLLNLCERIMADGAKVILVDNTEAPYLFVDQLPVGCMLITLRYNSGIAHAQNRGVAEALRLGAGILVFFDQDSEIEAEFLPSLVAPLNLGAPAITAPLYVDVDSNEALSSVRLSRYGFRQMIHKGDSEGPYPVDIVISSGTAATREVFDVAGGFDEALFIDSVDTEWCLRCRDKRVPINVVPTATMRHRIGSRSVRVGNFTILVHTPVRCYYQIRNCFHLLRKAHVPIAFAATHMVAVMMSRTLLLFFAGDRFAYIRAYVSGVVDGLKGVGGAKQR